MKTNTLFALSVASCLVAHAACAEGLTPPRDPFEHVNRAVNEFNYSADKFTLRPAATVYEQRLPLPVRNGISNFFGNLGDAWSAVNSALQLKGGDAAQDVFRFAFNSVFGLAGVLDIAGDAGVERHKADFGMTLASWGVPSGPYIELPIFGPSTLRDTLAMPVDWIGNPIKYVTPVAGRTALTVGRAIDVRARVLPIDPMLDTAIDRYTLTRDMALQHRQAEIAGDRSDALQAGASEATPQSLPQGQ